MKEEEENDSSQILAAAEHKIDMILLLLLKWYQYMYYKLSGAICYCYIIEKFHEPIPHVSMIMKQLIIQWYS